MDLTYLEIGNGRLPAEDLMEIQELIYRIKHSIGLAHDITGSMIQQTLLAHSDIDIKVRFNSQLESMGYEVGKWKSRTVNPKAMRLLTELFKKNNYKCEYIQRGINGPSFLNIQLKNRIVEIGNKQEFMTTPQGYDLFIRYLMSFLYPIEKKYILLGKYFGQSVRCNKETHWTGFPSFALVLFYIGILNEFKVKYRDNPASKTLVKDLFRYTVKYLNQLEEDYYSLIMNNKGELVERIKSRQPTLKKGYVRGFGFYVLVHNNMDYATWNITESSTRGHVSHLKKVFIDAIGDP